MGSAEGEEQLDAILGNSIGRVINNWACNLCGFINDAEDNEEERIEEAKLEEIRQFRLSIMLEKVLVEEESSILNMSAFRLKVKLTLADVLAEVLVEEAGREIGRMARKRELRFD